MMDKRLERDFSTVTSTFTNPVELGRINGLLERCFSMDKIGIQEEQISQWNEHGVLPQTISPDKQSKISLSDYSWLKITEELQDCGMAFHSIKQVKEYLYGNALSDEAIRSNGIEQAEKIMASETTCEIPVDLTEIFHDELLEIPLLLVLIVDWLTTQSSVSIIVGKNGHIVPFKERYVDLYYDDDEIRSLFTRSHISVSLSQILADILQHTHENVLYEKLAVISKEEMEVIDAIRQQGLTSVNIKLGHGNRVELIEKTEVIHPDPSKRLSEYLVKDGYEQISIQTQKGRIAHCERKQKVKPR